MQNMIIRLVLLLCVSTAAQAQYNSRNWANISQYMVGAEPSMTGTAVSTFNSLWPFKYYSLEVNKEITASPWTVLLEGSNDQFTWATITSLNSATAPSGGLVFNSDAKPVLYLRVRASVLASGDKITATAVAVP